MRQQLTIILVLSLNTMYAQNLNGLRTPGPLSPVAYAITKVDDLPVSYFTGMADISIPLFSFKRSCPKSPSQRSHAFSGLLEH